MLWGIECLLTATTGLHDHPVHEYVYCLQGSGVLESGGHQIPLCSGSSYFVSADQAHRFLFDPGEHAHLRILCLDRASSAAFLSPPQIVLLSELQALSVSVAHYLHDRDAVEQLLGFILADLSATAHTGQLIRWSAVGLLLTLHGELCQMPLEPVWQRYRGKIVAVREWLDEHLDQPVSIEKLVAQFGMSRSILTREFRRHVGFSVIDYCNLRRVERAAQILATSTCAVTQVAYEAGFANISHFHRQFKAVFGVTPASFRRQIAGGHLDNVV